MIPAPLLGCNLRTPATDAELSAAERMVGFPLPPDYVAFMRETNGLEGFVAPESYLVVWAVSELPLLNAAYGVSEFLPGVVLIGTDGGDTGYGFMPRAGKFEYVSVPLVGMELAALKEMGNSLFELAALIRGGKS